MAKARERAREILENAELKAKEVVSSSLRAYEERVKEARERKYRELREIYERRLLDESMRLNIELLKIKNEILDDVRTELIDRLRNIDRNLRKDSLRALIKETLNSGLLNTSDSFTVYVIRDDVELVREILMEEGLEGLVKVSILDDRYLGGLMFESSDGGLLIDNTYATRLERTLSLIAHRLSEKVFKRV